MHPLPSLFFLILIHPGRVLKFTIYIPPRMVPGYKAVRASRPSPRRRLRGAVWGPARGGGGERLADRGGGGGGGGGWRAARERVSCRQRRDLIYNLTQTSRASWSTLVYILNIL